MRKVLLRHEESEHSGGQGLSVKLIHGNSRSHDRLSQNGNQRPTLHRIRRSSILQTTPQYLKEKTRSH